MESTGVLDTKYKIPNRIKNPDFNQIVTYALAKRCHEAILVYPNATEKRFKIAELNEIRVQGVVFPLDGDLDKAGEFFVKELNSIAKET